MDKIAQATGVGGREENPDAASPSSEKPRNSSGSASVAASLLDLRMQVTRQREIIRELCRLMGMHDAVKELDAAQQRGFRRNRG